jgi:hypothetical protein
MDEVGIESRPASLHRARANGFRSSALLVATTTASAELANATLRTRALFGGAAATAGMSAIVTVGMAQHAHVFASGLIAVGADL